jgi:hypothetical protein
MRSNLRGRRFLVVPAIQEQSLTFRHAIPSSQSQQWPKSLRRYLNLKRNYPEGYNPGSRYFVTEWGREIWTRYCRFHGTIHLHVRFSVSHKTFISLSLEKTECKLYEHKWLASNKLNHKTGSILKIRAAISPEKPVNFYQNTWHCNAEDLFFTVTIVRTSNFIQQIYQKRTLFYEISINFVVLKCHK